MWISSLLCSLLLFTRGVVAQPSTTPIIDKITQSLPSLSDIIKDGITKAEIQEILLTLDGQVT